MQFTLKKDGKRLLVVILASFLMALNIKSFVRTGDLFPGGATGLTLLVQRLVKLYLHQDISYTLINILLNAFPVYIGFRFIGKKFTLFSCLMIFLTGLWTDLLPGFVITQDILLISIFGGIINGFCISLCLSVDATTGGTDFIGIFLSERKGMDSFPMVLGINVVILVAAGFFFGWDRAYQQGTVLVVTEKAQEICDAIYREYHHGATILTGEGSHIHKDRKIVYSVVSRAETTGVVQVVRSIDPDAFINIMDTKQVAGRFYFRPED